MHVCLRITTIGIAKTFLLLKTLAGFEPGASDPEAYAMPMSRIYLTHSDLVFLVWNQLKAKKT
jgi:hypothetical protein